MIVCVLINHWAVRFMRAYIRRVSHWCVSNAFSDISCWSLTQEKYKINVHISPTNSCHTTLASAKQWFKNIYIYIQQRLRLDSEFFDHFCSMHHFKTVNYDIFLACVTVSVQSDLILTELQRHLFQRRTACSSAMCMNWSNSMACIDSVVFSVHFEQWQ